MSLSVDVARDLPLIVGVESGTPAAEAGLQVRTSHLGFNSSLRSHQTMLCKYPEVCERAKSAKLESKPPLQISSKSLAVGRVAKQRSFECLRLLEATAG